MDADDFVPFTLRKDSASNDSSSSSSFSLPVLITDVRAPWMQFSQSDFENDSSSSSLVRLHNEMLTFCEYVAPTKVLQVPCHVFPQVANPHFSDSCASHTFF